MPAAPPFVALDFETANPSRTSACALAVVRVEGGAITGRGFSLIQPPSTRFTFTHIHGITWADVLEAPTFGEVWRGFAPLLEGAAFYAAHWAPFDRGVLRACLEQAGLSRPLPPFLCTVALARQVWALPRHNLPTVAAHLEIPLQHHDAASDAEACAKIALAAQARGWDLGAQAR